MPIEAEAALKALLADHKISAISLDTNVFDAQKLNFNSAALKIVSNLTKLPFIFILSQTVFREICSHLNRDLAIVYDSAEKAIVEAVARFENTSTCKKNLLDQITGGISPDAAATKYIDSFMSNSGCKLIDDTSLVSSKTIFDAYFNGLPPFSHRKKAEFPDALALFALEEEAKRRGTAFLVVSQDVDWRAFCEKSETLYLVPELKKALALINNTPLAARRAFLLWLKVGQDGRIEIGEAIKRHTENINVDVDAMPSSGQVEISSHAPEVRSIQWPDESEITFIETIENNEEILGLVANFSVILDLCTTTELDFFVWDSVDKESISMGGREIKVYTKEYMNLTVEIEMQTTENEKKEITFLDTECDLNYIHVDLGEIEVFEHEGYKE